MKRIIKVLVVMFLTVGLVACGSKDTAKKGNEKGYPKTIQNYNGAGEKIDVTFEKKPEKVLVVYQNSIETMLALGLEDKIVAAAGLDHEVKDEYKDQFKKVKYLDDFTPDKESVMALKPDMILSWSSYFGEKTLGEVDYWHDKGIATYVSSNTSKDDRTLEQEYKDILNLGEIFEVEDKAEALVKEMKDKVAKVSEETKSQKEQPKVLVMEFMGEDITVYGKKSLAGDMVKSLNAEVLDVEGAKIDAESLVALNPDVVLVVYMDEEGKEMSKESVKMLTDNKKFKSLKAVNEKKVYPIELGETYCSGIRTSDGLDKMIKSIYPNLK